METISPVQVKTTNAPVDKYALTYDLATGKFKWAASAGGGSTGWSITPGYTILKAFNPQSTTENEIARVLGTLIDELINTGVLGA